MEAGQPILAVPGSCDFAVLEFVDVDGLDGELPVLCGEADERCFVCAGDFGANDNLISILDHVLDGDFEIGKSGGELNEDLLHAFRSSGLVGRRRNINPLVAEDPIKDRRVFGIEYLVPKGDVMFVSILICHVSAGTQG